jgi:hypothetical protein
MRRFLFPTQKTFDGPWLFSRASLEELDAIIAKSWGKFELRRRKKLQIEGEKFKQKYSHLEKQYEENINEQVKKYKETSIYSTSSKLLYVYLKNVPALLCENFDAALKEISLLDKRPTGFNLTMISGDINFSMIVDSSSSTLEVKAEPDDVLEVQQLYSSVYEWVKEIQRQTIAQRIWAKVGNYRWLILVVGLVLPMILTIIHPLNVNGTEEQLFALYKQGITNSNVVDAVNLLVILRQDKPWLIVYNPWVTTYLGTLIYFVVTLSLRPKVELGIGKGRDFLFFWKFWQWIVLLIPAFLFRDVLISYLADLYKNFLFLIH